MADTFRTKDELLTLFATNTTHECSEQDVRDLIMSTFGGIGSIVCKGGTTTQTISVTPAPTEGWTAIGPNSDIITTFSTGEIEFGTDGVYNIETSLCLEGTNDKAIYFVPYIDTGTGYVDSGVHRTVIDVTSSETIFSVSMSGHLTISAGDKLKLYVWSPDGGTAFLLREGVLSAKRIY